MKKLDQTPTLYQPEKAEALAKELQDGDPEWKYVVKHDPKGTGYSLIEVYDEDGILIARM